MEVKLANEFERYAFTLQRVGALTPHEARMRAEKERDEALAEVEQLRYERRLLGACRRHLDEIADPEGRYTVEAIRTAGDLAQRIVDEIGHSVTDEPALGPSFRYEIERLSPVVEAARE